MTSDSPTELQAICGRSLKDFTTFQVRPALWPLQFFPHEETQDQRKGAL